MNAKINPVTVEILRNAFFSIANDMNATLMRSAYLNARNLAAQVTVTVPGPGNAGLFETPVFRKPPETAEYQSIPIPPNQPASGWIS